jgi:hypothetical protein
MVSVTNSIPCTMLEKCLMGFCLRPRTFGEEVVGLGECLDYDLRYLPYHFHLIVALKPEYTGF